MSSTPAFCSRVVTLLVVLLSNARPSRCEIRFLTLSAATDQLDFKQPDTCRLTAPYTVSVNQSSCGFDFNPAPKYLTADDNETVFVGCFSVFTVEVVGGGAECAPEFQEISAQTTSFDDAVTSECRERATRRCNKCRQSDVSSDATVYVAIDCARIVATPPIVNGSRFTKVPKLTVVGNEKLTNLQSARYWNSSDVKVRYSVRNLRIATPSLMTDVAKSQKIVYKVVCQADGNPAPEFKWINEKTGAIVSDTSEFNVSVGRLTTLPISTNVDVYRCETSNRFSMKSYKEKLLVYVNVDDDELPPPPPPGAMATTAGISTFELYTIIVGTTVGTLCLVLLIAIVAVCCRRKTPANAVQTKLHSNVVLNAWQSTTTTHTASAAAAVSDGANCYDHSPETAMQIESAHELIVSQQFVGFNSNVNTSYTTSPRPTNEFDSSLHDVYANLQ